MISENISSKEKIVDVLLVVNSLLCWLENNLLRGVWIFSGMTQFHTNNETYSEVNNELEDYLVTTICDMKTIILKCVKADKRI